MKSQCSHAAIVVLSLLVAGAQPALGTVSIPSDTSIGTWDEPNRIYTLTTDVQHDAWVAIEIDEDNLTLDGDGYTVTPEGAGGVGVRLVRRTGVTVKNVIVEGFYFGIYLSNSNSNTLTGNTTSNNSFGIRVDDSSNNTLTGNMALNNHVGISSSYSSHNILTGNTTSDNDYGIATSHFSDNTLTGNTAESNTYHGIGLGSDSNNNTLTANTTSSNYYGIRVESSSNNTLTGNTCELNTWGIFVNMSSSNNTVTGNTASYGYGGIYLSNSSDYNTLADNTSNSNDAHGIYIGPDCNNNSVTGNTASSTVVGISLHESDYNTVSGNTTNSNTHKGITLHYSSDNTVTDNTASNNSQGIGVGTSSNNNTLAGNTVSSSNYGIILGESNNNTLSDNTTENNNYGIYIHMYSSSNEVIGNTVNSNTTHGIAISPYCSKNILTDNMVSNNGSGIMLWASDDNQIYNNNFIDNITQASVGSSSGNIFNLDKPIGGNYWSDWTIPDADNDGFVDYPYVFTTGQDDLPWAEPDGWLCKDPGEMIVALANQMLSLNLQHGISNSLEAKLAAALQVLADDNENNDAAAINALGAFINAVEAQRDKKIPEEDADALIARAQRITDCMR